MVSGGSVWEYSPKKANSEGIAVLRKIMGTADIILIPGSKQPEADIVEFPERLFVAGA